MLTYQNPSNLNMKSERQARQKVKTEKKPEVKLEGAGECVESAILIEDSPDDEQQKEVEVVNISDKSLTTTQTDPEQTKSVEKTEKENE